MKLSCSSPSLYVGWMMIWLVTNKVDHAQGQSNATTTPVNEIFSSLNCGGEKVDLLFGLDPWYSFVYETAAPVALPEDALDRPVCGGVTPGGRGYWFPVLKGSFGDLDLLFCTTTDAPLTMTASVYQAARISENEVPNCEDMSCVAIANGAFQPPDYSLQLPGNICPNASNSGGVHFTASHDQLYFVHVDVTTNLTALVDLEAISYVIAYSDGSPPSSSFPSLRTTSITSLLLYGLMK